MAIPTPPAPPIWMAAPPEVHSTLLTAGTTEATIVAAGLSWEERALEYAAAAAELEQLIGTVSATYRGESVLQFIKTQTTQAAWYATVAVKAGIAGTQHAVIAATYRAAVTAMPTILELGTNHLVHGVLVGTNFFGVNTAPIAVNEGDYVRMWVQAADVMEGYDAGATGAQDSIPPTPPSPTGVIPGVGEASAAAATAAGEMNIAEGVAGGVAINAADGTSTAMLGHKMATAPASFTHGAQGSNRTQEGSTGAQDLMNTGGSQIMSMIPQAIQGATQATQGLNPTQLFSQAPQLASQAPQLFSQLLGQAGAGAGQPATGAPVGFSGTSAINGMNSAGMTRLAGGAFGSGPSRPMLPSTWGMTPTTGAAEPLGGALRGMPLAEPAMAGSGAGGGAGSGSGMLGGNRRRNGESGGTVHAYNADDAFDDEDAVIAEGVVHR